MMFLELLLVWFVLSPVLALALGAMIRAGRDPEASEPPVTRIAPAPADTAAAPAATERHTSPLAA